MPQVTSLPEGVIVRRVRVNRARSLQEALAATCRFQYVKKDILVTATPSGTDEEVEVVFISLDRFMTDQEVDELIPANFRPADLWELAAVNEGDFVFVDTHRNFTRWRISGDKVWRWAAFDKCRGLPVVYVNCGDDGWHASWHLAIVQKEQKQD